MTQIAIMRHEFVNHIPDVLDEGVLYISILFTTAAHMCCCGCGVEVVTPIDPGGWAMTFDGRSVSLKPSIGNSNLDCQSHYWIERGQVRWAQQFSKRRAERPRLWNPSGKGRRTGIKWKAMVGSVLKWLGRLNRRLWDVSGLR